jgi:hypothetical protein
MLLHNYSPVNECVRGVFPACNLEANIFPQPKSGVSIFYQTRYAL